MITETLKNEAREILQNCTNKIDTVIESIIERMSANTYKNREDFLQKLSDNYC